MKVQKQYPKLFKTLARLFGARKAVKLISSLSDVLDGDRLSEMFYWNISKQGHKFWLKVDQNAARRIKGYQPL